MRGVFHYSLVAVLYLLAVLAGLSVASVAAAEPIYAQCDFDTTSCYTMAISPNTIASEPGGNNYLGEFTGQDTATFFGMDVDSEASYYNSWDWTLSFDLLAFGDWQGNSPGPGFEDVLPGSYDHFGVEIQAGTILTTFEDIPYLASNHYQIGFSIGEVWGCCTDLNVTFTPTLSDRGSLPIQLQPTWGLDNVKISMVPEPDTAFLLAGGLVLLACRRKTS